MYNKERRNYELGIELCASDEAHLRKFIKAIDSDAEIINRHRQIFTHRNNPSISDTAQVRIYSKHLVKSLMKYGIIQNKTYETECFIMPDGYERDFIRGYFDGNGSIFYRHATSSNNVVHDYLDLNIVAHPKAFIEMLHKFLAVYDIGTTITKDKNTYVLNVRQRESVNNFLNYIYYSENIVRLDRKYLIYQESCAA